MLYKLLKEIIGAGVKDAETDVVDLVCAFDGTDGEPPLKDTTSSVGVDNAVGGFKNDPGVGSLSGNLSNNPVTVFCNPLSSLSIEPPKRPLAFESIS